jgi:hypothetical protein
VGDIREVGLTVAELRRSAEAHAAKMQTQGLAMLSEWLDSI